MKIPLFPFRPLTILGMLALLVTLAFTPACDDGGDNPRHDPVEITGDAALTIENPWEDRFTVYFDGMFIGRVQANSTKTWSVPVGNHTVLIDNGDRDWTEQYSGSYRFVPRFALILGIDVDLNGDPVLYVL